MSSILYSLKNTTNEMTDTNKRLSSGLKVSSALDDPIAYFAAQDHTNEATNLSSLTDSMGEGIQLLNAADDGIAAITSLISDAKALAKSALSADTTNEATRYMDQFNALLDQIDDQASDSGYQGVNLLGGTDESLDVNFDSIGDSKVTLTGFNGSSSGLGLSTQVLSTGDTSGTITESDTSWLTMSVATAATATADATYSYSINKDAINDAIDSLDAAKTTLRSDSKTLSTQLSTITNRQTFTNSMIENLNTGASNLVNADTNTESANLLALQTQQSLATSSLSIASSSMQNVLKLF